MSPDNIERVFGRGRLQMVTGEHVEVFREEALPGERRRYTKRFLSSMGADFRHWTEREWRILARLVGHGIGPVPDVVQFDRGALGRPALVQTYDAGITVDHWATLLPVERDGYPLRHVFEDCAHWWALARHGLIALDAIHELQLVHLDLKADNVCIPCGPADFDPARPGQALQLQFEQIALIDFAFSLVSGEPLQTALPIGHQADYAYQSPRLLHALEAGRHGNLLPTRQLDWRCDMFSLAAMLRRYLPSSDAQAGAGGWSNRRLAAALSLIRRLVDAHDSGAPAQRPHKELIALATRALRDKELELSLQRGWRLARHDSLGADSSATPVTRIALPVTPAAQASASRAGQAQRRSRTRHVLWASGVAAAGMLSVPLLGEAWTAWQQRSAMRVALADASPAVPATPEAPAASASAAESVAALPPQQAVAEPTELTASQPAAPDATASAPPAPASAPAQPPAVEAAPVSAPLPAPAAIERPKVSAASPVQAAKAPPRKAPKPRAGTVVARRDAPPTRTTRSTIAPAPPFAMAAGTALARTPAPRVAAPRAAAVLASPAPAPTPAPAPAPTASVDLRPTPPAASPASEPPVQAARAAGDPAAATALPDDFALRAHALIAGQLPRVAQRAERRVLRVLHAAAHAENRWQNGDVLDAARTMQLGADELLPASGAASADARLLHEAAETVFWGGRNALQALSLQTRAFGADPHDVSVAGNLAFYLLKQRPVRAETARELALYALALSDPRFPQGRIDDWTSFAIASALTGRERDARNALFVTLALSHSVDRQCRTALAAVNHYGERLRGPTEAMLARIHTWGRSQESSFCRWPPSWWAGARG
jgi:hypothetical protein